MAGKGAPKGNQYAKKGMSGRTIGVYITPEELMILQQDLALGGRETSQQAIDRYARQLLKQAIQERKRDKKAA